MVWGYISHQTRSQLVIIDGTLYSDGYRDILYNHVRPLAGASDPENFVYVDDSPHRVRIVQEYIDRERIERMKCKIARSQSHRNSLRSDEASTVTPYFATSHH